MHWVYTMVEVIVEHEYIAKERDELTIKRGDIIRDVVAKQNGWSEGLLNDRRGLFPDNFVRMLDGEAATATATVAAAAARGRIRKCRVTFSYARSHEDELALNVGDVIEVLGEEEEGWWRGRLNGLEGVFPSNFVQEIGPAIAASGSVSNSGEDLTSSSDNEQKTPSLPPKPTKILCEVKYNYHAQNDDELSIKEGDLITLISKDGQDAGWWRGELNGKMGVFPDNFVAIIEEKSAREERQPNITSQDPAESSVASKRKLLKSSEPVKSEMADSTTRTTPPAVPGKKPVIPLKKSPSASGSSSSGIFSGIKKKIVDAVDGASASKKQQVVNPDAPRSEAKDGDVGQDNAFDQVGRNQLLLDVRATRAKAPGRRLPRGAQPNKEGESPVLINGNSDYGSLEENLSLSNTSIEQQQEASGDMKPKVREWEKHKAPWLEEMKLNQAKRTTTSPGPETRNKLTPAEAEDVRSDQLLAVEKEASPVDMSKSMPSFTSKPLKTSPSLSDVDRSVLRSKPNLPTAPRPQSIDTAKPTPAAKTPFTSPVMKPMQVVKPSIPELKSGSEFVTVQQFSEVLERLHRLEEENRECKAAIEDLRNKLQVETEMRMLAQAENV